MAWPAKLVAPTWQELFVPFFFPSQPPLVWACQAISQVLRMALSVILRPWLLHVANPKAVSLSIGGANVVGGSFVPAAAFPQFHAYVRLSPAWLAMAVFLWCGRLPGPDVLPGCLPYLSTTVWDAGVPVIFRVHSISPCWLGPPWGILCRRGWDLKLASGRRCARRGIAEVDWAHLSEPQCHCKANAFWSS